jgi:hypothetical protein
MSTPKDRLQAACRRLALAPVRVCRSLHRCCFCMQDIRLGESYRDRGYKMRAHTECFAAVNREVNK